MGYSKLVYEDYEENIDYWYGELGVELPRWADKVSEHGCKGISAIDFYDEIFGDDLEPERMPEDYKTGEYGAIALEIVPNPNKNAKKKLIGKRRTITQDQKALIDMIEESENFCMMSPISYAGRRRTIENARYLYAMVIEIDGIIEDSGIVELFYSWERTTSPTPRPTFLVCSGTGVHLYYVFERPIPLWANVYEQLNKARQELIPRLWNTYVSSESIQFESISQGFRVVGTRSKEEHIYAMAFEVGPKVSIEYMNSFIREEDNKILNYYKSNLSLAEAKEKYPKWYQRRLEEGQEKGHYSRHQGIYYNWVEKIAKGAEVGHRYNCLEALCALGVQCNIEPEQVEKDCRALMLRFESLTKDEKNHFTEYDVICAMRTYERAEQRAYERNVDVISKKTGIPLQRNKRNGRKRADHVKRMNALRDIDYPNGTWRNKDGRPDKKEAIKKWRLENPNGTKAECNRQTKIDPKTIRKWWDNF